MRKKRIVSIGILLMQAAALDAQAMLKIPSIKLCSTAFNATNVVHAKVRKHEHIFHADDPDGAPDDRYELDIVKTYRGPHVDHMVVVSEMGTQNVNLLIGKEYILFPYGGPVGQAEIFNEDGEAQGALVYTKRNEHRLLTLLRKKFASIQGQIIDHESRRLAGVSLTIGGEGRQYTVLTDSDGNFDLALPPGTYRILVPHKMDTTIYSPDANPIGRNSPSIPPMSLIGGQCMQVQLQQE